MLGTKTPVGQALGTPLMVGLARAIYNPRPGELAGALRDPAELCSRTLTDRAAVEALLFDAFIPAAYRLLINGRWKARQVEKWLVFLACHLENTICSPDLAWWQLPLAVRGYAFRASALAGAVAGTVAGVFAGGLVGVPAGLLIGATVGAVIIVGGMFVVGKSRGPSHGIRWRKPSAATVKIGPQVGIVAGCAAGIRVGIGAGLIDGVVACVGLFLWSWLDDQKDSPLDIGSATSPSAVLSRDRMAATVVAAMQAINTLIWAVLMVVILTIAKFIPDVRGNFYVVLAGVVLVIGTAVFGTFRAAWLYYQIARILLAMHGCLPWQLMAFLADAHRRGVLRQAGAVYQFRHIELQRRLASRK